MLPLAASCPLVITVHDLIPFLFQIESWPKQMLVKLGYKAAIKKAAHVIAVSQHTACDLQEILRIPKERVTVVHNAARRDLFRPDKHSDELSYLRNKYRIQPPYVLAASARNWKTKNLAGALAALDLARQISATSFATVVFGPRDGLKAVASGANEVRALGHIPAAELAMLFRNAHAFVAPSLYEGFGLPVLEAMCCGCPVLVSNQGSLPEVVATGGQVFAPGDITGMAHALADLLCHSDTLLRWRKAALERAADFSWEHAAEETLKVYYHVAFGEQSQTMLAAAD